MNKSKKRRRGFLLLPKRKVYREEKLTNECVSCGVETTAYDSVCPSCKKEFYGV